MILFKELDSVHLGCMMSLALGRIFSCVSIHKDLILALVYPMVYKHWIRRKERQDKVFYIYKNI